MSRAHLFICVLPLVLLALAACGDVGGSPDRSESPASLRTQGSDVAGWIEVAGFNADGTPATGATAYAVRAGRSSPRETLPDWPQADLDEAGHARIPVPDAATYDVGLAYSGDARPRTLIRDVGVQAGATVNVDLHLPELVPVEIKFDGDPPPGFAISAWEARLDKSRKSYLPARDEYHDARFLFGMQTQDVLLPAGFTYELYVQALTSDGGRPDTPESWRAVPPVVRAPGRVTFVRDPAPEEAAILLSFRVHGSPPAAIRRSAFSLVYTMPDGDQQWILDDLAWVDGEIATKPPSVTLGGVPGVLRWSGDGVEPGEIELPAAGNTASLPRIEIHVGAANLPLIEGLDIRNLEAITRSDEPRLHAKSPDPEAEEISFWTWNDDRLAELRPGWKATLEWGAWQVSRAVDVPLRGRLEFEMVPAGYLMATSPIVPTRGLGSLSVRRADGAWLGCRQAYEIKEDLGSVDNSADGVWPGCILGPLPEGDVELVILLGDEERRRITATVRANAITPFELTW